MGPLDFMAPPAHKAELPAEKIDKEYKSMRLKVFLGVDFGYAAYYLVCKNLSFALIPFNGINTNFSCFFKACSEVPHSCEKVNYSKFLFTHSCTSAFT